LIVGLSGKNNVISYLTGVAPERLHIIHRAAGRTLFIMIWIHVYGHIQLGLTGYSSIQAPFIRWGVMATISTTLIVILSIRPIRHYWFEFFLLSHIVLIVLTLVGIWMHQADYAFELWPCFLLWGLDRLARGVRVIATGRLWRPLVGKSSDADLATITMLSEDTVGITLQRRMNWTAGQYAFLILPGVSTIPFESHPFTMASISKALDGTGGPKDKELRFIIRARSGFTRRLLEASAAQKDGKVAVLVDGPYGMPSNLKSYRTSILIAGGSGVSFTLSLLLDHVHFARANATCTRRVVFVWIIRHESHLNWIADSLGVAVASAPKHLELDVQIWITQPQELLEGLHRLPQRTADGEPAAPRDKSPAPSVGTGDDDKKLSILDMQNVKSEIGRPDLHQLLDAEISISKGPVSVDVSGPGSLIRAVRQSLCSDIASPMSVLKGRPPVSFHAETYGIVSC